jgi:4-hydroxy-3-methylbut-2-en-1-yl diphosphate reductase
MERIRARMKGKIVLADAMGYCWGVRRTLDIIERAGTPGNQIATIGDVIHNPHVVERLRKAGIQTAESVEEAAKRGFTQVAITAHGAGPSRLDEATSHGVNMVDTTCPLVTKVQRLAQKLVRQGYYIVVYGNAEHPEVKGILGWAETTRACAAKSISDLPWTIERGGSTEDSGEAPPRKVAVISQTTKIVDDFLAFSRDLTDLVARHGGEMRVCNTICAPTTERQNAMERLAEEVDVILVIGGRKSSNTARLVEVGRRFGATAHHIESASDIEDEWLQDAENIGITAGASTPDFVIESVIDNLAMRGYQRPALHHWQAEYDLAHQPAY